MVLVVFFLGLFSHTKMTEKQKKGPRRTPLEPWQIDDARRLDTLYKERSKMSQEAFGATFGIGSQGMVWQYLTGHTALNIKAVMAFCRGLGCSAEEISPTLSAQIPLSVAANKNTVFGDSRVTKGTLQESRGAQNPNFPEIREALDKLCQAFGTSLAEVMKETERTNHRSTIRPHYPAVPTKKRPRSAGQTSGS